MDRKNVRKNSPQQLPYRIRWSGKAELDWERFASREEAEASAKQMVRPGESYTIEEQGEACIQGGAGFEPKSIHAGAQYPEMNYPDWQEPLLDALMEGQRNDLQNKIEHAEAAIGRRLLELSRTTGNDAEMRALKDGLGALKFLSSETKEKKRSA